jgi:ribosomal protein S18 acetylase RimI-like enzyme
MNAALAIEPARANERVDAFCLALQHLPPPEQVARVGKALELVRSGEVDPAGILVARSGGRVVGSLVCTTTPGAGSLIWPPQVAGGTSAAESIEDQLMQAAVSWLRGRGARLAQAMLAPSEIHLGDSLERNGLVHVTTLCYLRRSLDQLPPAADGRLRYDAYPAVPRIFEQTLLATYQDTQDCPELAGARTIEEILAGHQAQGGHDPELWWLARSGEQAVGVLLLTPMPEWDSWDVAYVGVVPGFRRQGLGRQLLAQAMDRTWCSGCRLLTLSVDRRNRPARQLYDRLGFEMFDEREVFLAIWEKARQVGPTPRANASDR